MEIWSDADQFCTAEFRPSANGHHPVITPENFTSLYRDPLGEVKLGRTPAADLQRRAISGEIPELERLCLLGQTDDSPIVRGWSHMLTGYPKTGKTELLTRLVAEWSKAGLRVVYFTEEPESVWAARLSKLPEDFDNLYLVFAMGSKADDIYQAIQAGDEDVVVLDTIRLLQLRDENDNAAINLVLTPFIALCRQKEETLVLAHHTRKGSGDYSEAAAGGHAFVGIVDVALELHRDKNVPRRRLVKGWGRVIEVHDFIYELDAEGVIKHLGDPGVLELQEVKNRAKDELTSDWLPTKEILEEMDDPKPSRATLQKALEVLAQEGKAERNPPMSLSDDC